MRPTTRRLHRIPIRGDPDGGLSHILRVFLIDEAGLVRNIYSMDFLDPDLVLTESEPAAQPASARNGLQLSPTIRAG
ncbi:hypothetical protein MESS4_750197 [Mesorhizobium sp. STM 4661]|nr:hypothetical protein MESS4_750197 [Mesorhizobium sp. STM 4661]